MRPSHLCGEPQLSVQLTQYRLCSMLNIQHSRSSTWEINQTLTFRHNHHGNTRLPWAALTGSQPFGPFTIAWLTAALSPFMNRLR